MNVAQGFEVMLAVFALLGIGIAAAFFFIFLEEYFGARTAAIAGLALVCVGSFCLGAFG